MRYPVTPCLLVMAAFLGCKPASELPRANPLAARGVSIDSSCNAIVTDTLAAAGTLGQEIHEAFYTRIGGIEQWIQIRGKNRANPVVLVLHGGPGSTWDPLTNLFTEWEQRFVMVYWSQRGAGKTYRKTGPAVAGTMTIDRMVDDGIEVTEFIRQHLHKSQVILLAHSWGTVLGVMMAQLRSACAAP